MTANFYDELAPYYHLLYGDWDSAISSQGAALGALFIAQGVPLEGPVLDAACGIGTQTIGLLRQGFRVIASDISPGAIDRLKTELARQTLEADAYVDDLRTLAQVAPGSMAAVIACDNSLPHLLSDDQILQSLRSCYRCLRPNGIVLISVRDYAELERKNPDVRPYGLRRDANGNRFVAVQAWEWDGDQYDLRMYLTTESADGACKTLVVRSRYYAVSIARLRHLMVEAGFVNVERHDDVFFQPILMGRRK
ncbi:bifunctional 2-polyprenyl-6-hydroxyphenol methylase/3-demethylubiquinol 3-O-methyltransferase UbiG [Caenimonas sp. SL110]|uniref:class I SAM-dependent methyltransferase n=1 Tax=Caenimonas sp. SL110 TaxID=1450524 RepID=UPI00065340A1|nr:class I SAM-dependent methyltransferase [Caenimonas sp. SL110]